MSKQLISSDQAVEATCQHERPCSDCPWSRNALPGWLGGATPQEWITDAHSDSLIPCHVLNGAQCAGLAIYRANVCKSPRNKAVLRLPANRESVFALPNQFIEHHTRSPKGK